MGFWTDHNFEFENFKGATIQAIEVLNDENRILFTLDNGRTVTMCHEQDCCESVYIESIVGDLNDLIGSPVLLAEESTNSTEDPDDYGEASKYRESFLWTFYRIGTIKGSVVIRWLGESNGYYSESVSLIISEAVHA